MLNYTMIMQWAKFSVFNSKTNDSISSRKNNMENQKESTKLQIKIRKRHIKKLIEQH